MRSHERRLVHSARGRERAASILAGDPGLLCDAVFGWGFGFSGPSVYLAELQRAHGWSTGRIAAAITAYYLLGALCLARVDVALRWFGAGWVVAAGTVLLGLGASVFARSQEPWELYVAAVPMGAWLGGLHIDRDLAAGPLHRVPR